MKFKLRHMEVFRAVMVSGSINGAAKILNTSQPGLSKTISYLEKSLGLTLFNRTKASLIPTKEAQILFSEIRELYSSALRIDDLIDNLKKDQQGRLAVAASPSLCLTLLPRAIKALKASRPDIQIMFRSIAASDIAFEILGKKSELVISTIPIENSNLACQLLFRVPVVCLMPAGHPLERYEAIELKQLGEYPIILYDRATYFGRLIRAEFEIGGVHLRSSIEVTRAEQACALVQAGLGLTLVSALTVESTIWSRIVVRPLNYELTMPVSLIHSSFEHLSAQALEFIQFLRATSSRPEFINLISGGPSRSGPILSISDKRKPRPGFGLINQSPGSAPQDDDASSSGVTLRRY